MRSVLQPPVLPSLHSRCPLTSLPTPARSFPLPACPALPAASKKAKRKEAHQYGELLPPAEDPTTSGARGITRGEHCVFITNYCFVLGALAWVWGAAPVPDCPPPIAAAASLLPPPFLPLIITPCLRLPALPCPALPCLQTSRRTAG